jgi:CRP/FNR family transcriptional regulator
MEIRNPQFAIRNWVADKARPMAKQPNTASLHDAARRMPIFSALDDQAVEQVLRRCHTIARQAGTILFASGEQAERFFLILAGQVKLYQLSPRGGQQILHLYGPGMTFGEAAVLSGTAYPAYAEVVQEAELLAVGRTEIRQAIEANPDLALGMLAGMSAKLREFNRLIEDLSLKDVPSRLAGLLLRLAAQAGADKFVLPQTKRDLAGQIGTVPETLSRALSKLKSAGLIAVRGRHIEIRNRQALSDLAQGA